MGNRISFTDCLYKYFDTYFWNKTKEYVCCSDEFRSLHNLGREVDVEFNDIIKKYLQIVRTEGTEVIFFIRILFFCNANGFIQDDVSAICKWNIPKKEKGLIIDQFGHGIQEPTSECVYGDDLVPIVRREEYGKMADLFLLKVFGNETVEAEGFFLGLEIADKLGLKILRCSLPEACTGRIVMVDRKLSFKKGSGEIENLNIKAGTVLIDFTKAALMSNNLIPSTLIHECVHWVFHRCAFELGRLYCINDEGFTCMKDKTTSGSEAAKGNKFIEIQTLGIVPRILAPSSILQKEVYEVAGEYKNCSRNRAHWLELVLDTMKTQHGLSTESMKRSLINSGFECFRGIKVYQDNDYLKSYCFEKGSLDKDETYAIPCKAMSELYRNSETVRNLLNYGEYVYADGHLIKNDPKYIIFKNEIDPEPTEYALLHASECFMKFQLMYPKSESPVSFDYGLSRVPWNMRKAFEAIYDNNLTPEEQEEARKKWENHKKEWMDCFGRTFGQTLRAMMDHFKKTGSAFDGNGISEDQVYRICDSGIIPRLSTIVALGGVFNMPYEVFVQFVAQSGHDFFASKPEIIKYKAFMDDRSMYKDIADFDEELKRCGMTSIEKTPRAK